VTKTISLKETRTTYSLSLDETQLGQEPIIIKRGDQPLAVLIPIEKYREFVAWQESRAERHRQLSALQKEREAFHRLRDQLLKTHRGQFVAVLDGQVVDSDVDNCKLAQRVYNKFGYVPIYIQRVEEKPTVYDIPSPEVVS
jgi:antitoxin (DNA-binding transcriptional repressor) of toxin-antitoxin stability system